MKFRLLLTILVCAAGLVAPEANAVPLSIPIARRDIHRVISEAEQPTAMRLYSCHRLSPTRVRCHVQIAQIVQPTAADQIGTITELDGMATATIRMHHHPSFDYIDVRY